MALAAGDALPPQRGSILVSGQSLVREVVQTTLDALDSLGDSIAGAVGIR
jgi:hypothetical protein